MAYKKRDNLIDTTVMSKPHPWIEREKKIREMVAGYMKYFTSTTMYMEAMREGWELDLHRYVDAIASVQSQMIVGTNGIGWDSVIIFGPGVTVTPEMKHGFFKRCQEQAGFGMIDVPIPTGKIAEWKKGAEWTKSNERMHAKKPDQRGAPKSLSNSAVDLEIARQIALRNAPDPLPLDTFMEN